MVSSMCLSNALAYARSSSLGVLYDNLAVADILYRVLASLILQDIVCLKVASSSKVIRLLTLFNKL